MGIRKKVTLGRKISCSLAHALHTEHSIKYKIYGLLNQRGYIYSTPLTQRYTVYERMERTVQN